MSAPTVEIAFTMMGVTFRRDYYAKKGDTLPYHSHPDFDHGCYAERGSATVYWFDPAHEEKIEAAGAAVMFRLGRPHSIVADEDDTLLMSIMPE